LNRMRWRITEKIFGEKGKFAGDEKKGEGGGDLRKGSTKKKWFPESTT